MQKKLIALAITAAFASAPAFADTQVYGLVDSGYGSVSNTATTTGGVSTKTGESGISFSANQTSKVGVKSTEDLGNGMKGIYQLEMGLSSNPGADAGFGKATVAGGTTGGSGFAPNASISPDRILTAGLDFGQGTVLTVGRMSSPFRGIVYGNDAFYGANLIGNLVTMDSALTSRVIAANVDQKIGAVKASVALLSDTQTADNTTDVKVKNGYELTAVYNQDALSVSGGYRNTKVNLTPATPVTPATPATPATPEATTKELILAANYDFGMAKLYGQYASVQIDQASGTAIAGKNTYETLGVNVPFTSTIAGYVQTSFGKTDRVANGSASDSRNMSAYAVGARYDMSKNTWAYADVGSAKQDNTTVSVGSKVDQVAVGLVHSF